MERKPGKFARGTNPGTRWCYSCKKHVQAARFESGIDLCVTCYEEAGLENEHHDGYHRDIEGGPNPACPLCVIEKLKGGE